MGEGGDPHERFFRGHRVSPVRETWDRGGLGSHRFRRFKVTSNLWSRIGPAKRPALTSMPEGSLVLTRTARAPVHGS